MTSEEQQEQVISLYYDEGKSIREISRTTGISKSSVHRIIKRAEDETKNNEDVYDENDEENSNAVPSKNFDYEADTGFPWLIVIIIAGVLLALIIWLYISGKRKQ